MLQEYLSTWLGDYGSFPHMHNIGDWGSFPHVHNVAALQEAEGRKVLQDIRGVSDVDEEFGDIAAASKQASLVKSPWRTLMSRPYRPQLVVALSATFWQQASGINT